MFGNKELNEIGTILYYIDSNSGYDENAKLIERREQEIPRYEDYELQIYNDTVMVWNTDKDISTQAMMTDAEFHIEFGDMGLPVDIQTIVREETHDLSNHIISPIDIIMRRRNVSRDEAISIYAQNKAENGANKVIPVDYDQGYVDKAKQIFDLNVVKADINKLPFEDQSLIS